MGSSQGKIAGAVTAGAISQLSAWLRGRRRNTLLALGVVGGLAFAANEAWRHYGTTHAHWENYSVGIDAIHVTPPPPWVHSDVKTDVVRLGSLENLSLLERNTSQRVAEAFALHPWVSNVQRVAKFYPASIQVQVAYRKPVAVVEVEHEGQPGLLPVDRLGILLPPEDFSTGQVKLLPRVAVGKTFPVGAIGTSWGDERVAAGALVAEALCDDWGQTSLFRIEALPTIAGGSPEQTAFEIVTRDQRRFVWGRGPGREASGEKTAQEKRARLLELLKNAESNAPSVIDLRT
jgi:hypothetical protein